MRGYQAQQGREISRCLKELRQLRKDALTECTGEPETAQENEPKAQSRVANDDLPTVWGRSPNEPRVPTSISTQACDPRYADVLVGPQLALAEAIQAEIEAADRRG